MRNPTLLFACPTVAPEPWVRELRAQMPELDVRIWPEVGRAADVDFAFVWKRPPGLLRTLPNLQGILSQLPRGAFLINVARGAHVIDADLLAALDSGHLEGATLDVTHVDTAAATLVENVRRHLSGRGFLHVVDRERGY